jgi:RHS repeat-associated protein
MFYNPDSGLYLTQHRAYDPVAGRWLSRDAIGESTALASGRFGGLPRRRPSVLANITNLYGYVGNNPVNNTDRLGLFPNLGLPPLAPDPDAGCPPNGGGGGASETGNAGDISSGVEDPQHRLYWQRR